MKKVIEEAEKIDKEYNTFITINKDIKKGTPIVVKDNICTKGIRTTAGSKILENYTPPFNATVIKKVKDKGFTILGKNTQDCFGFGTFSTNCQYKIPKNPYDKQRATGGSSGGTASFIKLSKHVNHGIAQSTGGSINCPAAFCGVVGLTPTYGLVSRYGLIDYANSFDRIGTITKTIQQTAELLTIIAGKDEKDQTSQKKNKDYTKFLKKETKKRKIAYIKEALEQSDKKVQKQIKLALSDLEKLGYQIEEISFPLLEYTVPTYYIIALAETSTNLAKFCGLRYGKSKQIEGHYNEFFTKVRTKYFSTEEKRRIMLGTFIRLAGYRDKYYLKAIKIKQMLKQEMKQLLKKYDYIITPTMPILPPKFKEIEKLTPKDHYVMDFLTILPSITDLPSISIPVQEIDNLPVGMQIITDEFNEEKLIQIGYTYEQK